MKITPEIKEQINILYLQLGTKAAVAREIGCSASTVSKYIIPNFKLPEERPVYTFEGYVGNSEWLIDIFKMFDNPGARLCELCMLGENEWEEMRELQKEIFV